MAMIQRSLVPPAPTHAHSEKFSGPCSLIIIRMGLWAILIVAWIAALAEWWVGPAARILPKRACTSAPRARVRGEIVEYVVAFRRSAVRFTPCAREPGALCHPDDVRTTARRGVCGLTSINFCLEPTRGCAYKERVDTGDSDDDIVDANGQRRAARILCACACACAFDD